MSKNKHDSQSLLECWARTLGFAKERLAALVKEVVEERQSAAHSKR